MLANMTAIYLNSNAKRGATPKKPDDFLIKTIWKTEVEQDVDMMMKIFGVKK